MPLYFLPKRKKEIKGKSQKKRNGYGEKDPPRESRAYAYVQIQSGEIKKFVHIPFYCEKHHSKIQNNKNLDLLFI